ncbi:hypothetical protein ANN_00625 [Periplaneta americana]|uniref:HTH CENPB-type domain-containing protein n=1 Tax=Periplaneta americana TaxID=6978 RepID=A0ABQ8TSE4_PERAM|nr:hypothetical protein ANN_00625 [Periplaneta americana]
MSTNLALALEEVRRGSLLRAAASKFGVPSSTLHDHYKGKHVSIKRGPKTIFNEYEEKELVSLLLSASRKGFPLTPTDVRHAAFENAEMCGYDNNFNEDMKLAGRQWLRNFFKRNPRLSIKKPDALSMSRPMGLNRQTVGEFFNLFQRTLEENNLMERPEMIFNMDESGLPLNTKVSRVISEKGNRDVVAITNKERGENVTVVACCSASGVYIPPLLIFKGMRRKDAFGDGLPPGAVFEMTDSGYIVVDVFLKWLEHFQKNRSPGKCLLILDGHASHCKSIHVLDFCLKNDIILMEPLDEAEYREKPDEARVWRNLLSSLVQNGDGRVATNGFRACGIMPFNPDVIPDHVFEPSIVFGVQNSNTTSTPPATQNKENDVVPELTPGPSRAMADITPVMSSRTTPQKSPKKRSFRSVVPIPQMETPPKRVRAVQKAAVLTTPEYEKTILRSKSAKHRVQLFQGAKNSRGSDQNNSGKASLPTCTKTPSKESCLCGFCGVDYYSEKAKKLGNWIQCNECNVWYHEKCVGMCSKKNITFVCGKCIALKD